MGIVLDIVLVAIIAVSVIYGAKCGFFKSLMSLLSGVAALFLAYTFTPPLSNYIKDTFVVDNIAKSLSGTFLSVAKAGESSAGEAIYDLQRLLENSQFSEAAQRAGMSAEELLEMNSENTAAAVESLAYQIAEPLSKAVSEIVSFIIIFVVAFVLLKLFTVVVGIFFKLPVLRTLDRSLGIIFGAVGALFFVWIFAMSADSLIAALSNVAPSSFGAEMIDNSLLVKFFANVNPIGALTEVLSRKA